MEETPRDQDISDVMRAEKSRGRRPVDLDEIRRQKKRRESLRILIQARDLDGLTSAMRESGRTEEQIAEIVRLWRRLRP